MQKASDLLKGKAKQLWTILPEASVFDALKLMAEKEIGAVMVMIKRIRLLAFSRNAIMREKLS